jgi:outer membrane receptor protein involved in Fe transport
MLTNRSYFEGCSDVGREGLMAAQRYPANFDGSIARAKASNWTGLHSAGNLIAKRLAVPGAKPTNSKLALLGNAQLAACDVLDGLADGIMGLPSKQGLNNLIVLNTAGITTRGLELSAEIAPVKGLQAQLSWSYSEPEFRAGSDDYGSSAYCGLGTLSLASSFCTVGPPRIPNPNLPAVVPWIDGNAPGRAPRVTWHAALIADPPWKALGWGGWARLDINHQDAVYERQIDGASFGRRTLVDARIGITRKGWSVEAWATNLADRRYIRASFGRFPVFYPTQPRPIDNLHADGRRVGVTARWSYR